MSSKLKQLWWVMVIFALCNALLLFYLYRGPDETAGIQPIPQKSSYRIGILKAGDFPEQEKMVEGILASLEAEGYKQGDNLHVDIVNGGCDEKKLKDAASKLVRNREDLIVAVSTDPAKVLTETTKVVPIVGVGMYHFQNESTFDGLPNFTGIADNPPVLTQIKTAARVIPTSPLGIVYNPNNDSSLLQLKILRQVAEQKNIKLFEVSFDPSKEAAPQFGKLAGHVKAVYVPEDPDVLESFETLVDMMNKLSVPIIGEQSEMVKRGALLSVSPSYYRMGFSGGRIAARLLKGDVVPTDIAITRQYDPDMVFNMKQLNAFHITLPGDLWQRGRKLYLYDGQPARP